MSHELYKVHRPKTIKEVVGQKGAVQTLKSMMNRNKIPHSLLFTGPSGCGKTTLARILAKKVGCGKYDIDEINTADFKGVDMVRNIRKRMTGAPISGSARVWIIDECHKLTNDAQNAFLKILEDTPNHVYFMLATTDPQKLIKTIQTRCTQIKLAPLSNKDINQLIVSIAEKENKEIPEDVREKMVEYSEGSARKALVFLNSIIDMEDEDHMIMAIGDSIEEEKAITVARLLFNPKTKWPDMAKVLRGVQSEDAENMRWMVLGYAKSILIKGGKLSSRAYLVIDSFSETFWNTKHAGLAAACYEIITGS